MSLDSAGSVESTSSSTASDSGSTAPSADESVPLTISYGPEPSQFGQLWLPAGVAGSAPPAVVVLIHGGFWRSTYGLDLMDGLAADLADRGIAAWNIEYRRVGESGGGYPGTLDDVAAAIDALVGVDADHPLDLTNVVFVGHSAGGHLALWAAGRGALPAGAPGAAPLVVPRLAIGQGPVFDLAAGDEQGLGGGAVTDFIGGSAGEFPDRYAIATPSITAGVPLAVIRAAEDVNVPAPFTITAAATGARAADGSPLVTVVEVPGDHFALIDPSTAAWQAVIRLITG